MAKVLKIALVVAAIAVNVIPGAGQAVSAGLFGAAFAATATGAAIGALLTSVALAGVGALLNRPGGGGGGFGAGISSRLSLDPNAPQVIIAGRTACPSQLQYFGASGANNERVTLIMVHAGLPVSGFVSLAINNLPTPYSPVTGPFAGVLTVQTADGTHTGNPFTGTNGPWGASDVGQGLAMSCWNWTYDKTKLASGLPQVLQFVVNGCPVYDPSRDSTRGGSGSMRADDRSTWAFAVGGVEIGRNPALFELTYRLGWTLGGRLKAGMGANPFDIDMATYIACANICDEVVNGSPRYRFDAVISIGPGSTHNDNLARIHASCGGRPIDTGGLIGLWVAHDDTATATMTLTDDDFVGAIDWEPLTEGQVRNTGRGSYTSVVDFYQAKPYPEVAPADLRALDNAVELVDQLDLGGVLDVNQARRVVNVRLRESRQGRFAVPAAMRTLALRPTQVVNITRARFGWTEKPFRVETMGIAADKISLVLKALAATDYADLPNVAFTAAPALITGGIIGDNSTNVTTDRILSSVTMGLTAANVTASDAGGGTATVTIPAHTRRYADFDRTIAAGTVTGLAYNTLFYLYYDDLARGGGTETFLTTTIYADSMASGAHPGRHFLGSITTPAAGGTSTGGSPPRPGGGGGPIP